METSQQQTIDYRQNQSQFIEILTQLGHHQHLQREKSFRQVQSVLTQLYKDNSESSLEDLIKSSIVVIKLMLNSSRWEDRYGSLTATQALIQTTISSESHQTINGQMILEYAWQTFMEKSLKNTLLDDEYRVRNQVGVLLKAMISIDQERGAKQFLMLKDLLLKNINDTFEREPQGGSDASTKIIKPEQNSGKTMHDTEGWKSLETSMRILQNIIEAIGNNLYQFELDEVILVITKSIDHINRFVREISYLLINAIFETSAQILQAEEKDRVDRFRVVCDQLAILVQRGLGDNWSQVRYAASLCARSFFKIVIQDDNLMEKYLPIMVPRMCMNRYYVAEGVKIYSIQTWREVFGDTGKQVITKFAEEVCQFYIIQTQADNHAVREAACHCIAELCTKVVPYCKDSREKFGPYVAQLLDALVDCFKDQSWPVRDSACVACGHFVAAFPEESKVKFDELSKLWFAHLSDNINSVREHSAMALISVMKGGAYQEEILQLSKDHVKENIGKAKTQKAASTANSGLENETQFGVAKPKQVQDIDDEHNNGQLYSCGSLAPKLKRGGGCMDHGFQRAQEPWEMTDGCIYLLRELSTLGDSQPKSQEFVISLLEQLADIGFIDHFKHAQQLKEDLFKSLILIVTSLGKKKFRSHVEMFFDPIFRNIKEEETNCGVAAQDLLLQLNKTYGEGIFKAIVENHDDHYLSKLQQIKNQAAQGKRQDFIYPGSITGQGQMPFKPMMNQNPMADGKAPWAK